MLDDTLAPPGAAAQRRTPPPVGRARAHSRLVKALRLILPMTMVAVVGVLAGLVAAHAIRRQAAGLRDVEAPIRMLNPHFFGRDNKGRAYTLGALQAARDERAFQRVLLINPSVTLDSGGVHPSTVNADRGVYHEDTRILYLQGHVRASDPKNSKFATDRAVVNTRTGTVTGASSLSSEASAGSLNSGAFDVYGNGDRVVFKGGVHARLNSR
jgi:lipopolysaccharide export system protein LptC